MLGIKGQIVDGMTQQPVSRGQVFVAVEQLDGTGNDVVFSEVQADDSGNFTFCSLPAALTFDVVAVATSNSGQAYAPTVVTGVTPGTSLDKIAVASPAAPVTFNGFVTATTGQTAATISVALSALQTITLPDGSMRPVTISPLNGRNASVTLSSTASCPAGSPANSNCASYSLLEPAANPSVGEFSAGKVSFAVPAAGDVLYIVRALASNPMSHIANCIPSFAATNLDASGNPLKASAGAAISPGRLDFASCF